MTKTHTLQSSLKMGFFFIICYKITIYANERQSEIEKERERDVHKLMNKYICLKFTSKISRKKEKKTD